MLFGAKTNYIYGKLTFSLHRKLNVEWGRMEDVKFKTFKTQKNIKLQWDQYLTTYILFCNK